MRSLIRISTAALGCLLLACSPRNPAPSTEAHGPPLVRRSAAAYRFYEVTGAEPGEILASMRAAAPSSGGTPDIARTDWSVRWRATWTTASSTCRANHVSVSTDITVTLPRWTPPPGASPQLAAQWDSFMVALSRHEAGHVDIATAAARQIRQAIEQMSAATCSGMDARARVEATAILDAHRARNEEYDARTRHGAAQNAVWPYVPAGARSRPEMPADSGAVPPAAGDPARRRRPRTWGTPRP